MRKPILFHDIDGVLFGEYNDEFQLYPGVKTWLESENGVRNQFRAKKNGSGLAILQ